MSLGSRGRNLRSSAPLLSIRLAVTFPAAEYHCTLASIKLHCLATDTNTCEAIAQTCYMTVEQLRVKTASS